MPLSKIITVSQEGPIDPNVRFVVLTTGGKRVCGVSRGKERQKQFFLDINYWPKPVKDAASEIVAQLAKRGHPIDARQVQAVIPYNDGLVIGRRIEVLVFYDRRRHGVKVIMLRGIVTDFSLPE